MWKVANSFLFKPAESIFTCKESDLGGPSAIRESSENPAYNDVEDQLTLQGELSLDFVHG